MKHKKPPTKTRVRVIVDQTCASPRENDNLGTMACWHTRYRLGDEQPPCTPAEYVADLPENSLTLPLYLYDHSGITMSTGSFGDPWDSGQVGYVTVSPERIRAEFGDAPDARDRARACLEAEVQEYAYFLEGQCYGYIIEEGRACSEGDTHWQETDSCWGFIGADLDYNGMKDHVPAELHAQLLVAMANPELNP